MDGITSTQLRALIANWFRVRQSNPNNKDGVDVSDVLNTDNGLHVALSNGQYFTVKVEYLHQPEFAIFKAQSLGHRFTHGWSKRPKVWFMTCDVCARQVFIRDQVISGYAIDEQCDQEDAS